MNAISPYSLMRKNGGMPKSAGTIYKSEGNVFSWNWFIIFHQNFVKFHENFVNDPWRNTGRNQFHEIFSLLRFVSIVHFFSPQTIALYFVGSYSAVLWIITWNNYFLAFGYQKGFLLSKFSWSASCWRNPGLGRIGLDCRIVCKASAEDMPCFIMR